MTGLDELRLTLDRHAHDLHDDHAVGRVGEIHARVRRVRRRRTAVAGVAAALVVGAAGTVALLPGDLGPAPAERELIGREAPATLESLGYTYHFADGVEASGRHAEVQLGASDEPRLITWASEADEVGIIGTAGAFHARSGLTDFDDFLLVPPGESGEWSVRAEGAPSAIAVYELGDERPPGRTVDGLTFREQVGSDRLADVALGEPGDTDVSMEVTLPEGRLRLAEFCTGVPRDDRLWVNVSAAGQGATARGGCSDDRFDPGAEGQSVWYEPGQLGQPGETVTLRAWVSPRIDGPPVDAMPGVQLGLALYRVAEPAAVVAGWEMSELEEHGGHLWRFVGTEVGDRGQDRLQVGNRTDEVLLAVGSFSRTGKLARVEFRGDSGEDVIGSSGAGTDLRAVLDPGYETALLRVRGDASSDVLLGFALYERVD